MNIDDLTIGQARSLAQMFATGMSQVGIDNGMTGRYVIVRCHDAGVHAGVLEAYNGRECVLTDARRMWYHRPAVETSSWYEGVANHGLAPDSKLSGTVARRHLTENCDIVLCTPVAEASIRAHPEHAQR